MRDWCRISNVSDTETSLAFSARTVDSRPGPGPLTITSKFFRPYSLAISPQLSCNLCCERSRFTRTTETWTTCCSPCKSVALTVSDSYDCVVERSMNVRYAIGYARTRLRARVGCLPLYSTLSDYFLIGLRGHLRVRALRLSTLST